MADPTSTNYERLATDTGTPITGHEAVDRKSILPWLLVLLAVLLLGWYLLSRRAQDALAPPPATPITTPAAIEPAPGTDTTPRATQRPEPRPSTDKPRSPARPTASAPERIAGQSPQPQYPPQALRRGEGGTILLRVNVGADGLPAEIDFARRSGSRDLDRAAHDAVRGWRFSPATQNGKPVAAVVEVPVEFKPRQ